LWPTTLEDAFDILDVYRMKKQDMDALRDATSGLAAVYKKTATVLKVLSDHALAELGVPRYLWKSIRRSLPGIHDCVLGRFDFARTVNGYKMLEFNSDAPGLMVEAFSVNSAACRDAGNLDPNEGCEAGLCQGLSYAVCAGLEYVRQSKSKANVVVTCGGIFKKNVAEASYLCAKLQPFSAQFAPLEKLSIDSQGLYDPAGKRIDVLVRHCNLKVIENTRFTQRREAPQQDCLLRDLVESRRLALINPPVAFLLENKAVQAAIWNFFETGLYFDESERRVIATYMLPTYMDPPGEGAYVIKPVHGAEGDSITLVENAGKTIRRSANSTYSDTPVVYQKYLELPHEELMTEYGPRRLHLVISGFVVGGAPSAICMRAGEPITDEMAWVVPLGLDDAYL